MRNLLLFSALLLSVSAVSHADTFNLVNNTFASGAVANGSVNINTTTGTFTSVNVTLSEGGLNYVFTGAPAAQTASNDGSQYYEYSFDSADTSGNLLLIDIPGASLVGYAGGPLCSLSNLCNGTAGYFALRTGPTTATADPLATGSLMAATAATPEPSSLVLLGTGVVGLVGAARRRFSQVNA